MDKCPKSPMIRFTDEQIIELYWQRDETAIKATAVKYGNSLFRIAYNILHDKSDCEECQNDAYLRIWNRIPPTRPMVFFSFISKIMRELAIDKYKEKSSQRRIPSELTVSLEELCELFTDHFAEDEFTVRELSRLISEYVRTLSKEQRYIFMSRFYFGKTMEHIAAKLGVNVSTIHRRLVKLRQGLRNHLEGNGVKI